MRSIIVDQRIGEEAERSLEKLGFYVMKAPSFIDLPKANSSHPDTLFFKLGDRLFTYADYTEAALPILSDVREYHVNTALSFVSDQPRPVYPGDCALNALYIGGAILAREASLSSSVKEYAESIGIKILNVKQGYPACSVLKIDEKSAVTADKGMARALSKIGVETLLISEGNIALPPHEYGFIGGASFVFSDKVCFFGDIDTHPDSGKIREFAEKRGLKLLSLSSGALTDLGGAVILE